MTIERALADFTLDNLPDIWHNHEQSKILCITPYPHYLVGGAITRTVLNTVYGTQLPIRNYDLAVGPLPENPALSEEFCIQSNIFRH